MTFDELLAYCKQEAKKADDAAHDMSGTCSVGADNQRSLQWGKAVAYYDLIEKLNESNDEASS